MKPRLLVVSDLDGSLLDHSTYSWDAARPALAALHASGAGLVLASSKTLAEMQALAVELGAITPVAALVVENGGALVFAPRHDRRAGEVLVLGTPREHLVQALDDIARETGARVRGFAGLSAEELTALCGLAPPAAALALRREYDEPFVLHDETPERAAALEKAAAARGLALTRGGRFFHLTGPTDKGRALRALLERERAAGRAVTTLALGDAPNDLPLLRAAERAVVLPRPDGRADPALAAGLPEAELAPHPGPRGWNAAVLAVLGGEHLPSVRTVLAEEVPR